MQAIHITKFVSSTDELRPQTVAFLPAPGPGEVLVDIACAALNHVDLLYAQGKHQNNVSRIRPPFTLGLEFAGTVLAVGPTPGADFKPGDRVFGAGLGAFASQIVVPTRALHYLPPSTDFRSACGFSATATVAYGSVALRGGVRAGDWVLVHGAAGGIGVYACQIAKALGAHVIAGLRRREDAGTKLRVLKGLGCIDGVVVTGEEDQAGKKETWEPEVKRITGGKGVDVVIDNVGLVQRSLRCLRPVGGKVVLVGFAGRGGVMEQLSLNRVLLRQAVLIGYRFGETDRYNPAETKEIWDGLMAMIHTGKVKPIVFHKRYYGLDDVRKAMADLQAKKVYGKAVIDLKAGKDKAKAAL